VFSVFSVVQELFNGNFTTEVTEDTEDGNNNKEPWGRGVSMGARKAGLYEGRSGRFHEVSV
jgi:hypothetical protein